MLKFISNNLLKIGIMDEKNIQIVVDIETTGLDYRREKIVEFAAVKLVDGQITEEYETLINPQQEIRRSSINIHGITQEMVQDAPTIDEVMPKILDFIKDYPFIAHNAIFDYSYINQASLDLYGTEIKNHRIDTQHMFREVFPEEFSHGLESLMKRFKVEFDIRHRAMADAKGLAIAFPALNELFIQKNNWQIFQLKNIDYLFERYLRIQQAVQTMQAELLDIKSIFKVYFEQGGEELKSATGELLSYQSKISYNYNFDQIIETLHELGLLERAVKINSGFVDRMISGNHIEDEIKSKLISARIQMIESKNVAIIKADKMSS